MTIIHLLQTTFIWLVLYLAYRLVVARERRFGLNRFILLTSLLAGLVVPWLTFDWATATPPAVVGDAVVWLDTLYLNGVGAPIDRSLNIWQGLFLVGVVLGLLRLLYGGYQIYRLRRSGRASFVAGVRVILLAQRSEPFAWGPYLFWSEELSTDPAERAAILAHERAHIRLGHTLDLLLFDLLLIPFWWHPLLYGYRAELRRLHEYQADAYVLRAGHAPKTYARLLLQRALTGSHRWAGSTPVLSHAFHTSSYLKSRIDMITQPHSTRKLWKYLLLVPALALSLYACEAVEETPLDAGGDPTVAVAMDSELQTSDGEKLYQKVEQMPVFGNCEGFSGDELLRCSNTNLIAHLFDQLEYPESAKESGLEGMALISFVVRADGTVGDVTLKRSSRPEGMVAEAAEASAYTAMDEAVLTAARELPNWSSPGRQEGKPVNTQMMLPVKFKLK